MAPGAPEPLGVAVVGYSFMGKAHSNAWRNVAAFYPDVPPVRMQVLVGRDADAVGQAARRYGWAEAATTVQAARSTASSTPASSSWRRPG